MNRTQKEKAHFKGRNYCCVIIQLCSGCWCQACMERAPSQCIIHNTNVRHSTAPQSLLTKHHVNAESVRKTVLCRTFQLQIICVHDNKVDTGQNIERNFHNKTMTLLLFDFIRLKSPFKILLINTIMMLYQCSLCLYSFIEVDGGWNVIIFWKCDTCEKTLFSVGSHCGFFCSGYIAVSFSPPDMDTCAVPKFGSVPSLLLLCCSVWPRCFSPLVPPVQD